MNRNLQEKLFYFEAAPPREAWEKLAAALDGEESFAQRLYNYEAPPPAQIWNAVESSLSDAPKTAKVIPLFTLHKIPVRYIAAASIVAAVLVFAALNRQTPKANFVVSADKPTVHQRQQNPETPANDTEETYPVTASTLRANNSGNRNTFVKRTLAYIQPQSILPSFSLHQKFIPQQAKEKVLFDQSSLENFMVYSDAEGNVMKLPKKLFSLVCCQDGDGSCKIRLQRLRQTLSANMASADFLGMLDMLRQLQ